MKWEKAREFVNKTEYLVRRKDWYRGWQIVKNIFDEYIAIDLYDRRDFRRLDEDDYKAKDWIVIKL